MAFLSNIDQRLADAIVIIYSRKYRAKNLVQLLKVEEGLKDINCMEMNISKFARYVLTEASKGDPDPAEYLEWKSSLGKS